jgi:predicted Rossmann fold flavoprotein
VRSITKAEDKFNVHCIDRTYQSFDLVIATGGCSYPTTGSSGDGYGFARDFDHDIAEIGPALTPVLIENYPFRDLAGLSFPKMDISLYRHRRIKDQRGDVLFTHQGLSGPGILDLSRYIRPKDTLKLSFMPRKKKGELEKWLQNRARSDGGVGLRSILASLPYIVPLSPKLIKKILEISGIATDMSLAHLTREMRTRLIDNLTGLPLVVSKLGGFDIAMVTRGGVELHQVNPKTMESRLVKRLYLIGEILDVDGDSGGYNLQAAFSTGMLSARSIKNNWT